MRQEFETNFSREVIEATGGRGAPSRDCGSRISASPQKQNRHDTGHHQRSIAGQSAGPERHLGSAEWLDRDRLPYRKRKRSHGAYIRDIASTELRPYVGSRAIIQGSNVLLPPKYALTVALIIHELATNAAKYGSLSVPEGRVSFRSTISDRLLSLEWRENGGPLL